VKKKKDKSNVTPQGVEGEEGQNKTNQDQTTTNPRENRAREQNRQGTQWISNQ
jgi:hypothetical protein